MDIVNNMVEKSGVLDTAGEGAVLGLRLIMTMLPIVILIIAVLIFRAKYKLTDEKLDEITTELEARHAAEEGSTSAEA